MKRLLTIYLPIFIWAGLIFLGSSTVGRSVSNVRLIDFLAHKFVHVTEYVIFYVLLQRSTKKWWLSLIILGIFAITDEIHQSFVPGRSPRITDVLIDISSGTLGIVILNLWSKLLPKIRTKLKK
ncbi:MAG: VanZ family protein [candidate division WWE3 bacterium]|nr:VanZ family protein [candidate division WWE3 bacterium]